MMRIVSARGGWAAALACAATLLLVGACKKDDKKGKTEESEKAKEADKGKGGDTDKPGGDDTAKPGALPPGAAALVGGNNDSFKDLPASDELPDVVKDPSKGKDVKATDVKEVASQPVRGFGGGTVGGFSVAYQPEAELKHELHRKFSQVLREFQTYEKMATILNSTLKLPNPIKIQLVECNTINAFYNPNNRTISMCYELMSYFADVFRPVARDTTELGNAILGATVFVFLHEAGHSLVDQLDLPVVAKEEDVVDGLATLLLIADGKEAVTMALSGAYWFHLQSQDPNAKMIPWDEHSADSQRYYNILCWIYGSDPDAYAEFVKSGALPEQRAVRCAGPHGEYEKLRKSFEKLLAPHLQTQAAQNVEIPQEPAPAPTSAHAIQCEQVVEKGLQIYLGQLKQQVEDGLQSGSVTQEQVEELKRNLEVQLPQIYQQAVDECNSKDWTDPQRECVMNASDVAGLEKCGID
jgi:hypothetical protein